MSVQAVWFAVAGLLVVWAACCFRISEWHRHEAGFWREIAMLHRLDIAPKDALDLLRWAKSHRPGVVEKLRGWKAPHARRAQSSGDGER